MGENDHGWGCKELTQRRLHWSQDLEGGREASTVVVIKSKQAVNTYLRAVPVTDVHDLWHAPRAVLPAAAGAGVTKGRHSFLRSA